MLGRDCCNTCCATCNKGAVAGNWWRASRAWARKTFPAALLSTSCDGAIAVGLIANHLLEGLLHTVGLQGRPQLLETGQEQPAQRVVRQLQLLQLPGHAAGGGVIDLASLSQPEHQLFALGTDFKADCLVPLQGNPAGGDHVLAAQID